MVKLIRTLDKEILKIVMAMSMPAMVMQIKYGKLMPMAIQAEEMMRIPLTHMM